MPIETLLSDAYNAERRKLITDKASLELRPGSVEGFGAIVKLEAPAPSSVAGMGAGEPTVGRMGEVRGDTVHFDIVDQAGNMVSSTPSGGWLQSSPVIPELGFWLGTRGQMFWLEEGHPAALAPGKRPRTTLSPTHGAARRRALSRLGLARRRPAGPVDHAVLPAPRPRRHQSAGGDRRAGLALRAFPDLVLAAHLAARRAASRSRVPKDSRKELAQRGHIVEVGPEWSEGRLTAASRTASAAAPPPIRAACRAMPPGADVAATGPIIVADNASKLFLDGAVVAFRQLSLAVERDEILCIVGPSGCGKTTFLRCIAGLTDINTGSLTVHGKPVDGPARRRRHGVPAFRPAAVEDRLRQRRVRTGDGRRAARA